MKKALKMSLSSFMLIYASCILFGAVSDDLVRQVFQYLSWSVPASLIIGLLSYYQKGEEL
ncbi:hypothetical protein [Streptococcus plurextorum]|uniref:hypothetical protein n=1 Tax=Streptococcus plurextorum TaxID=456876 RepID=UPI00042A7EEB|nr:hypothetical protein [Streptococcus plurextorum]